MDTFAVCVPCFNGARYLPELAASIAGQSQHFDEVILYDDASDDRSAEIAASTGIFTNIVRGEVNVGPGLARNRCLEAASASWIHFQDADDLMDPQFLERMAALREEADVVIASGTSDVGLDYGHPDQRPVPDPLRYALEHLIGGTFGLYRRATLVGIGGFAPDLARLGHEDPDLHVRLALAGARFVTTSERLIHHRRQPHSFSLVGWERCMRGAVVAGRRWMRDVPTSYRSNVTRGLELVGRECDRAGYRELADEAWTIAKTSGARLEFPSRFAAVRWLGGLLGADVASALRRGRVGTAWRRYTAGPSAP